MKIVLKRDWFAPNCTLYPRTARYATTEVPDEFRHVLPRDAQIVGEDAPAEEAPPAPPEKVETPADLDFERQNRETEDRAVEAHLAAAQQRVKVRKG